MKKKIEIEIENEILEDIDNHIVIDKIKNREEAIILLLKRALGNYRPKKAIFLLGGKGTRLRPITYEIPKALIPIHGKTVPEHLMELFKKYYIKEFIFSVGYKADLIQDYFGNGTRFGAKITYVREDEPMGSAGAIKLASEFISGPFIVTNGDELKETNIEKLYDAHKKNNALVTVALTSVDDPSYYGVAKLEGNKILEFIEKPQKEKAPSNLVNSGLSIWEPQVLKMIPNGFSMYEKDIFPRLAKENKLFGYVCDGQWFDIGTPERYETAIRQWQDVTPELST